GLTRQSTDHIVGLITSEFENRNAIGLERSPDVRQLLSQFARHFLAVRLVTVVLDFLKGLRLQIKTPDASDTFRLLIAEGWSSHIENCRQVFRREVIAQLAQHVDKNISRGRRQASLGRHTPLTRHGMIGAEDKRNRAPEKDAATVILGGFRLRWGQ